jgi:phosphoacetylglucosamine mutase
MLMVRESGPRLKQIAAEGACTLRAEVIDYNLLTTPQLHYLIYHINAFPSLSLPSEETYCTFFAEAFIDIMVRQASTGKTRTASDL